MVTACCCSESGYDQVQQLTGSKNDRPDGGHRIHTGIGSGTGTGTSGGTAVGPFGGSIAANPHPANAASSGNQQQQLQPSVNAARPSRCSTSTPTAANTTSAYYGFPTLPRPISTIATSTLITMAIHPDPRTNPSKSTLVPAVAVIRTHAVAHCCQSHPATTTSTAANHPPRSGVVIKHSPHQRVPFRCCRIHAAAQHRNPVNHHYSIPCRPPGTSPSGPTEPTGTGPTQEA